MSKKPRVRARVYEVVQYEINPETGESLNFNESNIVNAIGNWGASLENWAYVRHDKDKYVDSDHIPTNSKLGDDRPAHWHVLLKFTNQIEFSTIAKAFGVPENMVEKKVGQGAFLDCLYYLTHEDDKQRLLGKYVYDRDEIKMMNDETARQMWELVDVREERRAKKLSKGESCDVFLEKLSKGKMTLKQVYNTDSAVYAENETLFKRARRSFLKYAPTPLVRSNYHISGLGGSGKTVIAKAMARAMFPDKPDDEIFFVVGDGRVAFDNYDGQPVIIWDDFRANELLNSFDRGSVWKLFAINPDRVSVHVKNGETTLVHTINIVTSVEPFQKFIEGLVKEFKKNGNTLAAEDVGQAYRRFPLFIEVTPTNFQLYASMALTGGERELYQPILNVEVKSRELAQNQSKLNNSKVFGSLLELHSSVVEQNSKSEDVIVIEHKEEKSEFFNAVTNKKKED